MDLYLLHYNNYFNKIIRKEETLEEYLPYQIGNAIPNVNFIPNDGINTEQIINWTDEEPDYLLVSDAGQIKSRWFVMSTKRERGGQFRLTLRRDVVADFRDEVLSSTAYIRKAMIPSTNKLIYNSEGMSFNQIKTREDLLYDKTKTPWIVGYVDPKATDLQGASIAFGGDNAPLTNYQDFVEYAKTPLNIVTEISAISIFATDPSYTRWDGATVSDFTRYDVTPGGETVVAVRKKGVLRSGYIWRAASVPNSDVYFEDTYYQSIRDTAPIAQNLTNAFLTKAEYIKDLLSKNVANTSTTNNYLLYNGKIVHDTKTDTYYKITVEAYQPKQTVLITDEERYPGIYYDLNSIILGNPTGLSEIPYVENKDKIFFVTYSYTPYAIKLTQITYGNYSVTLHDSARVLQDAPYRMFCMRFSLQNFMLAINLATNNGSKVYDVQLLPYCPVQDYFNDDGSMKSLIGLTQYETYEEITEGPESSNVLDYLFWCTNSVGTFDILYQVDITDIKQAVECDLYRLCSPNGNGGFEFNAARNGGIAHINVDYTYRPYNPYIHLNPDFGALYGQDFNDFRGLVLNGDFSIPMINDKWVEYAIQNKNFENIFNREIQSIELQNKYAKMQDLLQAATGTLAGGISGGIAGSVAGPYGAVAGAVVGSVASAAGGIADIAINDKLRQDQINLKKDLFSYNLQNIQALPQSVSKTGCLTNNNKLVPYVEYYTCTDEEKEILAAKIKYTGMTVGAMGLISDYLIVDIGIDNPQYIEADIIEIDIREDYHFAIAIAEELKNGLRFA